MFRPRQKLPNVTVEEILTILDNWGIFYTTVSVRSFSRKYTSIKSAYKSRPSAITFLQGRLAKESNSSLRLDNCLVLCDETEPSLTDRASVIIKVKDPKAALAAIILAYHGTSSNRRFNIDGVQFYDNVSIKPSSQVQAGAVIGHPGLGIVRLFGNEVPFPDVGGVTIGSNVLIGANSSIARGAIEDTIIEADVKIGNNVNIGHNAYICSGATLASSCTIGRSYIGPNAFIGMGACIRPGAHIGSNAIVGIGAVVLKDVPDEVTVVGNPARIMEKS